MAKYVLNGSSKLEIRDDDGTTVYKDITCSVNELEVNEKFQTVDVTALCSTGVETALGNPEADASFMLMFDNGTYATSPQKKVIDWKNSRAEKYIVFQERGAGAGLPQLKFKALISEFKRKFSNTKDPVAADVSLVINGAIDDTPQT